MRAFTSNVSLDAWLFGEEKPSEPQPKATSGRANSLPAAQFMNRLPRPKKASFVMPGVGKPPPAAAAVKSKESAAKSRTQQGGAELPSYPFPVSSKLRKLFQNRPSRLQWNKSRHALAFGSVASAASADDKHHNQQLTMAAFERLQGHVPYSLKEIVKDPKKLPYLLQWLSTDDFTLSAQTNYHQVLLFLLEVEQLPLVPEEQRREQALKIWNKYLDNASEFQISSTLELTVELEQLVRDSIDVGGGTAVDGFFPIQKLAYMRLTREEMPRFLKSSEYLQMLLDTENDTESVPMERILEQPRAAHYFLLFLMQSRQHFELYFWLHVEYVLKPLVDGDKLSLFWKLARVLVHKAQNDSQAVTRTTKDDLVLALETRRMDSGKQPAAKALFNKAQQEIFVMLRSSWFDRFMKSKLYSIALKDSLIHLEREDLKEDSPPKLLSRSFSALAYAHRLRGPGDDDDRSKDDALSSNEETADTRSVNSESKGERDESDESESGDSSVDDSGDDDDDDDDNDGAGFSKLLLNLESIIRLTNLPDGLQVHYRPHYEAPSATGANLSLDKSDETEAAVDMVLTFATFVERKVGGEPEGTLLVMPVPNPLKPDVRDVQTRVKAFLVPDGRTLIRRSPTEPRPDDTLFPFQQSGRNGFLFGSVYLTYEEVKIGDGGQGDAAATVVYVAKGFCVLSSLPLVHTLRRLVESHITRAASPSEVLDHDSLSALFHATLKTAGASRGSGGAPSTTLTSHASALARRYSSVLNLPLSVLEARVDVSMRPLFEQFGTALALQILGSALLECSVVLVSSQYTLLTECAEAIRVLLRPFAWCHVYAPVLPKPLLSYLQCPTPILVGVHSAVAMREDLPSSGFYLVADMDRGTVEFVGEQRVAWRHVGLQDDRSGQIFLPRAFETAKRSLDRIFTPGRLRYDRLGGSSASSARSSGDGGRPTDVVGTDEQVRLVCLELFSGLLAGHTNACLVVGDTKESVVIFDETQFLSTRDPADEQFYHALMRAQCFSEIVSAHSIDMKESESELFAEPSAEREIGAGDDDEDDGVI